MPSSTTQPDWWTDMWSHMGGMMGGTGSVTSPYSAYFGILFVTVVIIVIVSAIGLVYFIMLPEIKTSKMMTKNIEAQNSTENQNSSGSSAYESVLKTLNEDEKRVLKVLRDHEGKYLQKYIRHEAKLSRLKTHRVLARFAERGMVSLQKTGNTNEVTLAEWLQK
ncbi:MAG: hypothetical protein P8Y18_02420 [Candidatus Bathyarchaeota archaeon]